MKKYIKIGNRLRQLRAHLSQKEFSKRLGISSLTYQRYEYGERMPSGEVLARLSAMTGEPVNFILGTEKKKEQTDEEIKDDIRRVLWINKSEYTEDDIERLLKHHREQEKTTPKPVTIITLTENSPLYMMYKQIEHIYNEGDKSKLAAVKTILNSLEGEKKEGA